MDIKNTAAVLFSDWEMSWFFNIKVGKIMEFLFYESVSESGEFGEESYLLLAAMKYNVKFYTCRIYNIVVSATQLSHVCL